MSSSKNETPPETTAEAPTGNLYVDASSTKENEANAHRFMFFDIEDSKKKSKSKIRNDKSRDDDALVDTSQSPSK
jgi:hypothetical protein